MLHQLYRSSAVVVSLATASVAFAVGDGAPKTLPAEYQQVEYIESDGNQWIDSEYFLGFATTRIECRFYTKNYGIPKGGKRDYAAIYGVESTTANRFFVRYNNDGANVWVYHNGGKIELNGAVSGLNTIDVDFGENLSYTANLNENKAFQDLNVPQSGLPFHSLRLFSSCGGDGSSNCRSAIRMMYFRIWEGENCVCRLVPCYLKGSDPLIAGFYDLAGDKFLTNAVAGAHGTGFAVGKDVLGEIPTVEINNPSLDRSAIDGGTFDFSCSSMNFAGTPEYAWYVDDAAEPVANGQSVSISFDSLGLHSVAVVANASEQSATNRIDDCVNIVGGKVYVNAESANPEYPFATSETAATTPEEALATAIPGCEVVVAEGTYATAGLKIGTRVCFRSEKGAQYTRLVAQGCEKTHVLYAGADYGGGAIVNGFTVDGSGAYGALSNNDGSGGLAFINNVVTNCRCGAVYFYNRADNVISNCLFVDNVTTDTGALLRGEGGSALFTHCEVRRNRSVCYKHGGMVNDYQGVSTVRNCLFADNVTEFIGGGNTCGFVVNLSNGGAMENCTVVGNTYAGVSPTRRDGPDATVTNAVGFHSGWVGAMANVRNCVIWSNHVESGDVRDVETSPTVTYTCSSNVELTAGECAENHNMVADPMFIAATRGNYHVKTSSPVVDAGLNQSWMVGAVDLDGKNRIYKADKDGVVDLGCYEKEPTGMMIMVQ